jgi:hypothetical protein
MEFMAVSLSRLLAGGDFSGVDVRLKGTRTRADPALGGAIRAGF